MRKIILLLSFLFFTATVFAKVDCNKHKIYCKIKELRPSVSTKKAMKLSNIIYSKAKKYKGDPMLAVAIGMQETGLRERNRKQNIIQFYEKCDENGICEESWEVQRGVSDICMFQFHINTILHYHMNPIKLKNDISYCTDWHFRLMNVKKRQCRKLKVNSWACYHSNNPTLRKQYIELVTRYL